MATIDDRMAAGNRDKTMVEWAAMVFGAGFLLIGVLGFFVTGMSNMEDDPSLAPRLFGLFPVNVAHNVVHLLFGIWGLAASRSWSSAKSFCQIAGVAYIILTVLGFLIPSTLGLMPIGGNDIWLHALLGIGLAYFGFTAREADAPARAARV